jgi:catechol 2,3-dioxygenase-like lactoylglutathione lyase family enzyme
MPADANGRRIIAPTLHHYGTMTGNIDAMIEWYGQALGFVVTGSSTSPIPSAYVSNDLVHHRGGFFTAPVLATEVPAPRRGVNHVAFEYDSLDDLLESWERLKDVGIEPLVTTCHGTHYAFYYKDPDGNTVELLADAWGTPEESYAFVGTQEFADNPMGPRVDPALLIEARKQGQSIDEIRDRTMRFEFQPESFLGPEVLM